MIPRALLWALLLALSAAGAQAPGPAKESLLIRAGRLIDVRQGRLLEQQAVLIEGDRIREVGHAEAVARRAPASARVIDLSLATVMPGLIDCHTHLTYDPTLASYESLGISVPREALRGAKNAKITLEAGFTTVRNVGARGYTDVALRDAIQDGDFAGPRILASGPSLGATGGHSDNSLLAPEFHFRATGVADGVPGVIQKTREIIKYGADCIKVMATGGVLSKGTVPTSGQLSDEELRAIVQEAHRLGRKVAAHAHGAEGLRQAVQAGVDSIEHGSYIDDEGIRLMKEKKTYLVPTLYLADWFLENAEKNRVPDFMLAKAKVVLPAARQNLARAFNAGVRVAFGTDAAVYPHGMNAREFAVMVKLGLTPMQTIQSATVHAADLLGWGDRVGSLEPGRFADLVAVVGDPLKDITLLENIGFVMKGGQVVKDKLR